MSEYDVQENPCNGNHSTCHPTRSFSGYLVSLNPAANGIEYELLFLSKTLILVDDTNPLAVVPSHLIRRSRQEFLRISRMDVSE